MLDLQRRVRDAVAVVQQRVELGGDWPFAADELVLRFDARELPAGAPETVTVELRRP